MILALTALGCQSTPSPDPSSPFSDAIERAAFEPASDAERDSALAVLASMQRTAFDTAFVRLQDYAFVREVDTHQLAPTGEATASRRHVYEYEAPTASQDEASDEASGAVTGRLVDSTGTFDAGTIPLLGGSNAPARPHENVATAAFPDGPAYLSARGRESFAFRLSEDTLPNGAPAIVVEIHPLDTSDGNEQSIRYARLTLDAETRQLLAAESIRAGRTLLYDEDSRFRVTLQPAPDDRDVWLPDETEFETRIAMPLRDARRFRTASTYRQYAPASPSGS